MKKYFVILSLIVLTFVLIYFNKQEKTTYQFSSDPKLLISKKHLGEIPFSKFIRDTIFIIKNNENDVIIKSIKTSSKFITLDQNGRYFRKDTNFVEFVWQAKKIGVFKEEIIFKGNFPNNQLRFEFTGVVLP